MSLFYLLLVALIQGLTEFLPVSSSGHLILLPEFVGMQDQGLVIDVAVHVGTLGAVVLYFWRDVVLAIAGLPRLVQGKVDTQGARLALGLVIATIPVVIAGFASGKIVALQTGNGREVWEAAVAVPHGRTELQRIVDLDADPVIEQGVLYVASYQGSLVAISLQNGRVLWSRDMSAFAGIAVAGSQVFVSDADSEVWSLDRRSGGGLWKQADLRKRALTGPVIVDDYIGVGDYDGYLHLPHIA